MKRLILLTLSVLTLSLAATPHAQAENRLEHLERATMSSNIANKEISPFELVSRAYQGEYTNQGIPGFGSFSSAAASGRIKAQDLIRAAIDAKQLSIEVANDLSYQNAVASLLLGRQH
jgi:hypothetical protein